MDLETSIPKRDAPSRRAAAKKVNYAALLNDDVSDEEEPDNYVNPKFDSDDEDELLDNTGIEQRPAAQQQLNSTNDMFDSLKSEDESPIKKPPVVKRKLGAKPQVVKAPSKRTKKLVSDSDDSSPVKV